MTAEKKTRNNNLTVPNAISVVRILLVPFFAYFFLKDRLAVAVSLLVLSGLSDLFDGMIARKFNQVTELGKMLDPLADKITQGVVALCLAVKIPEIRLILGLFIVKELVMLVGAILLIKKKKKPCAAQWYGKIATTLFYVSVTVIVGMKTFFTVDPVLSNVLLIITAVVMFYAAFKYLQIFLEILRSQDEKYNFSLPDEIRKQKVVEKKDGR